MTNPNNMGISRISCSTLIEQDSGILLVQERVRGADLFSLPGGKRDRGEAIEYCAERETKEETGLQVAVNGLAAVYKLPGYSPKGKDTLQVVFDAVPLDGALTPSKKHPVVEFFSDQEVEDMAEAGLIKPNGTLQAVRDHFAPKQPDIMLP